MKRGLFFLVVVCQLSLTVRAAAQSGDDLETARRKFEVWRQYPEQLAKLRSAAQTFAALPAARQQQIEQLDRDLAAESSATQAKLQDTLDRYNEWFAKLPEKDQARIRQAPDRAARLAIIKQLRDDEWLADQPKATRDAMAALPANDRPAALAKARAEDRQRRAEWQTARRFWGEIGKERPNDRPLPTKLDNLDSATQMYVTDVLMRLLSKEEKEQLAKAEGHWPLYPRTLVELADKHPPALGTPDGPTSMAELPKLVLASIKGKGAVRPINQNILEKRTKQFEGRYPEFPMRLTAVAGEFNWIMPVEWWAYNFHGLSAPMQEFVKKKLVEPLIDRKEWRVLVDAEGKWPDYPEAIQKISRAHHLQVPWQTLPGPRERWDVYRTSPQPTVQGYPELPKYKLRDFTFFDLDDHERAKLKNEIDHARVKNDEPWTYLVEMYFQRYPGELARLRRVDAKGN